MTWYEDGSKRTMNFLLLGDWRSGIGLVQEALNQHELVMCHRNTFHPNHEKREQEYNDYFGMPETDALNYYLEDSTSVNGYIWHHLFGVANYGERCVGVTVPYSVAAASDLWEHIVEWGTSVCVIHVTRNPVAVYISQKQFQRFGKSVAHNQID